jgi:hypothetical protein
METRARLLLLYKKFNFFVCTAREGLFLVYYNQHCYICRHKIPMRRRMLGFIPGLLQRLHGQSNALITRLDLIHTRPGLKPTLD